MSKTEQKKQDAPVSETPDKPKYEPVIRVAGTTKLKDRPANKRAVYIDLPQAFGFFPRTLYIEKVEGKNNQIMIAAVVSPEQQEMEEEILKAQLEVDKARDRLIKKAEQQREVESRKIAEEKTKAMVEEVDKAQAVVKEQDAKETNNKS